MHGDGHVGLYYCFPHLGQDDLTVRADKIVVSFVHAWTDYIGVEESLLDQLFHSLTTMLVVHLKEEHAGVTYLPGLAQAPWEGELPADSVLELDRRLRRAGWF